VYFRETISLIIFLGFWCFVTTTYSNGDFGVFAPAIDFKRFSKNSSSHSFFGAAVSWAEQF
jgi:hypothetical protein